MLIAEELALVAVDPDSGRYRFGHRASLNAALAGALLGELAVAKSIESEAANAEQRRTIRRPGVRATAAAPVEDSLLAAALAVVIEKGPKIKAILSHMDRGVDQRLGVGTWDAVVARLEAGHLIQTEQAKGRIDVRRPDVRGRIVDRLQAAAASDEALDERTAILLSLTGPAQLLEVVAPHRATRTHARQRIDHGLDGTVLGDIAKAVSEVLRDDAAR